MGEAHPYAEFINKVQKPARYLGGEYQAVVKDHADMAVSVCLAFPDLYDIGMSHLGTKILYSLLNDQPDIVCERAFAPWTDMEAELRARELPILSLETAQPLKAFDVVGFSLQYEMTFTNVLNMLALSDIPLRAKDRSESDPLIIAGGPVATHPEPVAPFLDALLIGDAEELLAPSLRLMAEARKAGVPKREILQRLAALGGWYCPALYEVKFEPSNGMWIVDPDATDAPYPIVRSLVDDLNRYPFPTQSPVPAAEAIFDRASIEIARGCTEGCRFCQAGMIYRPVRERDPSKVIDTVMKSLDAGGYNRVSLTSLSTADYSCVSPLVKQVMARLRQRQVSLSVSSLRAYGLDEDLLDEIKSVKATGLTFAPEAGTQRMRDVINKNISEEDILRTAERVFQRGWQRMKLYFMIGLPTEQDEDVVGIVETATKARDIGAKFHSKRRLQVTASASTHVPKPHTPFQWAAMDSIEDIQRKQKLLRDLGRRHRVTVKCHDMKVSYLEGIIARGDRTVADVIEAAWKKGARFDGWDEHMNWDAWCDAIDQEGLNPQTYLGTLPVDSLLPWGHIDVGLADGFLAQEWKRASKDRLSPPCGKPKGEQVHAKNLEIAEADHRKLVCYHCGVACDMSLMREERIDYLKALRKLGMPEPIRAISSRPAANPAAPNPTPEPEAVYKYRLRYTKLGSDAYTSQQDLARSLPRIFRRAKITLRVSQGFSPRPILVYGPALPLGVPSLTELVDIVSLDKLDVDTLPERLNAVSPAGTVFLAAEELPDQSAKVSRAAKTATYLIRLDPSISREAIEEGLSRAHGDEPVCIDVMRKKGLKTIDVRDGLIDLRLEVPTSTEQYVWSLEADLPSLRYTVDLAAGAHVRAVELAQALFGPECRPWVARVGLGNEKIGESLLPMNVQALHASENTWSSMRT